MNEELNKKNILTRLERKWAFKKNNIDLNNLIIAIFRSPFRFKNSFTSRQVNSIYFDDKNFSSILENLDGIAAKKKYRVRWYGTSDFVEKCSFEIKEKQGFLSRKTVIPINLKQKIKFHNKGINEIKNIVMKIINYRVNLIPILSTHYQRNYYLSDHEQVRATLDYDVKCHQIVCKQDLVFKKNFSGYIFELKYEKKYDNFVRNNLNSISATYSKSSKYINCATTIPQFFS